MILTGVMASVSVLTLGVAMGDDEDSPLHKLMEEVNQHKLAVYKAVRSEVAYKKSQKDIVTHAEALAGLVKQTREKEDIRQAIKGVCKKAKEVKDAEERWTELMDHFAKSAEDLAKLAAKPGTKKDDAKQAYNDMAKKCTDCHTLFRIEEE
jgi:cytochrome c556